MAQASPAQQMERRDSPQALKEQIREKAYALYQMRTRSGKPGSPDQDWNEAERIVVSALGGQSAAGLGPAKRRR